MQYKSLNIFKTYDFIHELIWKLDLFFINKDMDKDLIINGQYEKFKEKTLDSLKLD